MRVIFALASIALLLLIGCGEEENGELLPTEDVTEEKEEIEEKLPEIALPQFIEKAIDKLERGMEEEDIELYLEAFWDDDYFYHSDLATDKPDDDVMFEDIQREQQSLQGLFKMFDDFDMEFETKELVEIDGAEIELRSHYKLLASCVAGTSLPGGYQKVFAEGDNVFTFKKRGVKWRISRWKQEEMSGMEIKRAYAEINERPPEGALIHPWGLLKLF